MRKIQLNPEIFETHLYTQEKHSHYSMLDFGTGNGEFLIHLATSHPDKNILGCDFKRKRLEKCVAHALRKKVDNFALYLGNGMDLIASLPDASLEKIFFNFLDPWPKKRHRKRRIFYSTDSLNLVIQKLQPQGTLFFISDHQEFFEDMQENRLKKCPQLKLLWFQTYSADIWNKEGQVMTHFPSLYGRKWIELEKTIYATEYEKIGQS